MGRKILMVGLGGTGCKAVARIRERVINERKQAWDRQHFSDIQFVGFDTDQTAKGAYGTLPMVWTARSASVGDLLVGRDEWKVWFPSENNFLRARNGLRGAGQLRVLSRLFLEDTFKRENTIDDPLAALHDAFRHLQIQDGDPMAPEFVVMIISSFAGGTGSGIFIQMALYIRRYLMEQMHCNTALIRGLFSLPDIYTGSLHNDHEIESVYANAYASLKELCAINRLYSGSYKLAENVRLRYPGLFDSQADRDAFGRLPITKVPFNSIFFVDNVNASGQRLATLEAYQELIAEIAYMQIYSPMADNMLSQEDNQIRDTILTQGQRIFAAAGCSKIVYPHDEIVDYCVKRMMADNLDSDWLYFDKLYRKQYEDAKKRRQTDHSVQLPKRAPFLVDAIDQRLSESGAQFTYLRDDILITQEQEGMGAEPTQIKKQELFLQGLKDHLKAQVDGRSARNEAIKNAAVKANIDNYGKKREDIINKISGSEHMLQQYFDTVEKQLPVIAGAMVSDILPTSMTASGDTGAISLYSLLRTPDGRTVHPTSARYLLYALQLQMNEDMKRATVDARSQSDKVKKHFTKDWNDRKEGRQTPAQTVPRMHKRSFVEQYAQEREKCYKNIAKYAESKLLSLVLEGCAGRISELIHQYELFFSCLDDILVEQNREAEKLETKHDLSKGINTYIQASSRAKRRAYHQLAGVQMDSLSALYESILINLYSSALEVEEERKKMQVEDDSLQKKMQEKMQLKIGAHIRKLFDEDVAQTFRQKILEDASDAVNITVIRAMDKECADLMISQNYMSVAEPRRELLSSARARAKPCLMYDTNANGNVTKVFWGISANSSQEIRNSGQVYFSFSDSVVSSDRYSDYEISCYQAVYQIGLMDVPKFRDNGQEPGIYFKNYKVLLHEMRRNDGEWEHALTPHTDYTWIDPANLPMISDECNEQEAQQAARVFWLGWLSGSILTKTVAGERAVYLAMRGDRDKLSLKKLTFDGEPVDPKNLPAVYEALARDTVSVEEMAENLEKFYEQNRTVRAYTEKALLKTENPLIAAMIDAPDARKRQKGTNVLTILGKMLTDDVFAQEEAESPALTEALLELVEQLKFTRKEGLKQLKMLIYHNSAFNTNARWRKFEPEWLANWKSAKDDEPIDEDQIEEE